jgi:hypothetical protein
MSYRNSTPGRTQYPRTRTQRWRTPRYTFRKSVGKVDPETGKSSSGQLLDTTRAGVAVDDGSGSGNRGEKWVGVELDGAETSLLPPFRPPQLAVKSAAQAMLRLSEVTESEAEVTKEFPQ